MNWCPLCKETLSKCVCDDRFEARLQALEAAVKALAVFPIGLGCKNLSRLADARDKLSFFIEQCS